MEFSQSHEYTQLDELIPVFVYLSIAFMIFAVRRWREAEKEKGQRGEAEKHALARNLELSSLYEITSAIGRTMDMRELFAAVLDKIVNLDMLGMEITGGVAFVSDERRLRLLASEGMSPKFLELHSDMRPGQCLCGLCAENGEIITSEDCDEDERHTMIDHSIPRHGRVIVPLKAKDRVEGVLALYTEAGVHMETGTLQVLGYVGNQMGIALENLKLYERTRQMSLHDPLTGLANRRLLFSELEHMYAGARRHSRPLSVIMLDLDHFKDYNDAHGHAAGDRVLSRVASIVTRETRKEDVAARYGGEEFLLVLPEADSKWAIAIAERIRRDVESAGFATEEETAGFSRITLSLGVASLTPGTQSGEALIGLADRALYAAKRKGRNRVEIYHQDDAAAAS